MALSNYEIRPEAAPTVAAFWTAPDEALFRQSTVAAVLGLTEAWCERARWSGEGPTFFKLNRAVRYRKRDVTEWINQRSGAARTQAGES